MPPTITMAATMIMTMIMTMTIHLLTRHRSAPPGVEC